MSSGLWEKNDNEPGLFGGGQNKGLWSSPGHDTFFSCPGSETVPGTGQDTLSPSAKNTGGGFDHEWEKLEEKYYEDFDSRADLNEPPYSPYYPYGKKDKYEPQLPGGESQPVQNTYQDEFKEIEDSEQNKTTGYNSGTTIGGSGTVQTYREEEQQITNVRRGGHKRLKNKLFSLKRYEKNNRKGRKLPDYSDVLNRKKKRDGNDQPFRKVNNSPPEEEDFMVEEPPSAEEYEKFSQEVDKERLRLEKLGPSKDELEARKATADFFKFMYADYGEVEEDSEDDHDTDDGYDRDDPYKNLF